MGQSNHRFANNDDPIYNIGAVSRMTDIPETTLRAWERRYDFPKSTRTAGRHRLYSQQQVGRLQWVKARVDEGMQISQAIRALEQQQRDAQGAPTPLLPEPFAPPDGIVDSLGVFRQRLVDSLFVHDADLADRVLAEAFVLFPLENLVLDVIGPTFHEIGEAWSEGRVDVATEHFASHLLRHHLLMWMRSGPPAYPVSPVVLACAPGELHEGSLLMLAVLLRRLRWPVIYLGQAMPLSELASFVHDVDVAVLVFVAMTEETAHALADWPSWLPDVAGAKRPVVGYGGRIFVVQPEIAAAVSGTLLGQTLREGLETLNRMLHEMNPVLR